MTAEEWLALEVGDILVDRLCSGAHRRVLSLSRVSGKRGQRGKTRTMVKVANLVVRGAETYIASTDDGAEGKRFARIPRAIADDPNRRGDV